MSNSPIIENPASFIMQISLTVLAVLVISILAEILYSRIKEMMNKGRDRKRRDERRIIEKQLNLLEQSPQYKLARETIKTEFGIEMSFSQWGRNSHNLETAREWAKKEKKKEAEEAKRRNVREALKSSLEKRVREGDINAYEQWMRLDKQDRTE